jgi:hypothetical protein
MSDPTADQSACQVCTPERMCSFHRDGAARREWDEGRMARVIDPLARAETIREADLLHYLDGRGYETVTLLCQLCDGAWAATADKPTKLKELAGNKRGASHTAVGRTRLRALHALVLKIEALPALTIVPPQAPDAAG